MAPQLCNHTNNVITIIKVLKYLSHLANIFNRISLLEPLTLFIHEFSSHSSYSVLKDLKCLYPINSTCVLFVLI